jgi:hypothetical protein
MKRWQVIVLISIAFLGIAVLVGYPLGEKA